MKKNPIESKYCRVINTISILLLIGSLLFVIVYWLRIPDQIPSHYDEFGNITSWSGKFSIFVLLFLYVLVYSIISFVGRYPDIWNTAVKVTARNKNFVYLTLARMIATIKLFMVCIFTYLIVNMALAKELSPLFTLISLGSTIGGTLFFLLWLVIGNRRFK